MASSPGFVVPEMYASEEELENELRRQSEASGFTQFDPEKILSIQHSYADKPALNDDLLIHFGIPGMKWGRRKVAVGSSSEQRFSAKQVKRIAAVGAASVATALFATGNLKSTTLTTSRFALKGVGFVSSKLANGTLSATYFTADLFTQPLNQIAKLY